MSPRKLEGLAENWGVMSSGPSLKPPLDCIGQANGAAYGKYQHIITH